MRVIISRKGFDSGYGGVPSPILPDGRMISLPIPDDDAPTVFADIDRDGINLGDLVVDLTRGRIDRNQATHLDPDLHRNALTRRPGWRAMFGQASAALTHLQNEEVNRGDLFLFFGWFRDVERVNGHWGYRSGSTGVHALWGWLFIDAIHDSAAVPADVASWASRHPHIARGEPVGDSVFIAADQLSVGERTMPGSGLFAASPCRVLTAVGFSKSHWHLPAWLHPDRGNATLTYHRDLRRWSAVDASKCRMRSVAKGQEFVLNVVDNDLLTRWLAALFADVPAIAPRAAKWRA